jgi:HD-GYP domain-containing protein (c-di-GMP phosphodiesterase class II)
VSRFQDIVPIVRSHHERYDGKGYPDGLKAEEIPEEARIIAVADAFDAMTSTRRYRDSLGFDKALQELRDGRGAQFDPVIADAFLELAKDPKILEYSAETGSLNQTGRSCPV